MKYALAGAFLMAATTAVFAAKQPPDRLDRQNLQVYQQEMNPQAALDQARRDNGTGLEGPDLGDGQNGSQPRQVATIGLDKGQAFTPFNGYKGEM